MILAIDIGNTTVTLGGVRIAPQQAYSLEFTARIDINHTWSASQSDARIVDKIAKIEESGTKILTLDDQTRADIREASQSVYESIKENIDPAIYNAYMDGIE